MTFAELQTLIEQGEGQRLELKRDVPSVKDLALLVVCLANAPGGKILLGVDDRGHVVGCRSYNVPDLLAGIYRTTDPPITVDIEEASTPHGAVLVVSVPRTAFVHGTTGGVFRRRVRRECLPMLAADVLAFQSERGGLDYSARPVRDAGYPDDVDPRALAMLRGEIEVRNPALAHYADLDLLRNLGLLTDGGGGKGGRQLTVAAALLLGRTGALRRALPQVEVTYLRLRSDTDIALDERLYLPLPLLLQRLEELIQVANEVHLFLVGLQRIDVPAFPVPVYREAILNAVAHRNYGLPGNIFVRHYPDRLEVMNPGGFPAGVTPQNILRQVVSRNRLLAETLQRVGYVERAGSPLSMEELLLLRYLKRHLDLDQEQTTRLLQRQGAETAEILSSMVRQGLLERVGAGRQTVYQLAPEIGQQLDISPLGCLLTPEQQEDRVLQYVQRRGRVANSQVRMAHPGRAGKKVSRIFPERKE